MTKKFLNNNIFIKITKIKKYLHNNIIFLLINQLILYLNKLNQSQNKLLIVIVLFPHKIKKMKIIKVNKIIQQTLFNNKILKKFINLNIKILLLNKEILFPMKM